MNYKSGFTLAEVLITLGIIGVVAALTIPVLVKNYQEKLLVNKAKKTYAIVNNAIQLTIAQNGYTNYSQLFSLDKTSEEIMEEILQNLSAIKVCKKGENACWGELVKYSHKQYQNGVTYGNRYYSSGPTAILKDGTRILINRFPYKDNCDFGRFYTKYDDAGYPVINEETGEPEQVWDADYRCGQIMIDTNGKDGPNQLGADTFDISVYPDYLSLPKNDTFMKDGKLNYEDYKIGEEYEE